MAGFIMFLSSYSPLFVILAVQFFTPNISVWCIFAALAIAGVTGFAYTITYYKKSTVQIVTVKETHISGGQAVGYLSGYLLPFIAVDKTDVKTILGYLVFFVVTYQVTVRTDVIQINPLFFMAHYRIYATEVEYPEVTGGVRSISTVLISKKPLVSGEKIKTYQIDQSIRICK